MNKDKIKLLVLASMFFCLGLVLPFFTGQIPKVGNMLLPMHIPVLLCGLICGWQYGAIVGFSLPIVRSLFFGMPVLYPAAISMAFELLTYGLLCGILYGKSRWKCITALYRSLLISMIGGRIIWGISQVVLLGFSEKTFTFALFITNGFINAIPGIILQLVLIPSIMLLVKQTQLITMDKRKNNHNGTE